MANKHILTVVLVVLVLGFGPAQATVHEIIIGNNFFSPLGTTVQPGDTVVWTWLGGIPHSTTSDDGLWDSGITSLSDFSFGFVFSSSLGPGPFPYKCVVHPFTMIDTIFVDTPTDVGDDDPPGLPNGFNLSQNYPNPFNPTTTIEFALPERSRVNVAVYDIIGRKVVSLVDGNRSAGDHSVVWDGTDSQGNEVASGIYFYRITAGDFNESRAMVLLK